MTIAPITQAEINNVEVTREGDKLRAVSGILQVSANVADNPDTLRTRATLVLALANYIDNPPAPPFDFPQNHAAVIMADSPMVDGKVGTARFTRIEDSGWFSSAYGWQTEATIVKDFTNLRIVSEGVPGADVETPPPGEQGVSE